MLRTWKEEARPAGCAHSTRRLARGLSFRGGWKSSNPMPDGAVLLAQVAGASPFADRTITAVGCWGAAGLRRRLHLSKTDQRGRRQAVAVWANPGEPGFCPAAALEAWLAHRRQAADLQD